MYVDSGRGGEMEGDGGEGCELPRYTLTNTLQYVRYAAAYHCSIPRYTAGPSTATRGGYMYVYTPTYVYPLPP